MVTNSFTSSRISPENKIPVFDYLRAFMVMLVVFEHALLPYSPLYKNTAYVPDFGGNLIFDIFHLHNDAVMMPFLFFLAGIFVFPSLDRRGLASFSLEKFYRLIIPYVVGVFILVPPQTYGRYLAKGDGSLNFWDYYTQTYLWDDVWSSGFWFLGYLLIMTAGIVLLRTIWPTSIKLLGRLVSWMFEKPLKGYLFFFALSALFIGSGYLYWGPLWVKFFTSLSVRGERLIEKIFYFTIGIGFAQAQFFARPEFLQKLGTHWKKAFILALLAGVLYMTFAINYFYEGAYNYEFLRFRLHGGGSFDQALEVLKESAPMVLCRTTLLAFFMTSLSVFYLCLFNRFLSTPHPFWRKLAAASFGIYVFHETIQVPLSYVFTSEDASEFVKFACVFLASWGGAWALTLILKKLPGFRKVL